MKALIQRVSEATVTVDKIPVGAIGNGLLVFIGIGIGDDESTCRRMADKVLNIRLFTNDKDKFDKSIRDISGSLLVVSQFTLYANCSKGRRPGFENAQTPEKAQHLYTYFIRLLKDTWPHVETGRFGAAMAVTLTNDGPVTVMIDL